MGNHIPPVTDTGWDWGGGGKGEKLAVAPSLRLNKCCMKEEQVE